MKIEVIDLKFVLAELHQERRSVNWDLECTQGHCRQYTDGCDGRETLVVL